MSGFTSIPDDVEDWQNPVPQLLIDHLDSLEAMDLLASRHEQEDGALPPSEMLGKLAELDLVAIGRCAIRLHNTAQQHYRSILDDSYHELMEQHWTGELADRFDDYMAGGGDYRGMQDFLMQLRNISEYQALAFLNICESVKSDIDILTDGLSVLLANIEAYVQLDEQASSVKAFIDEVVIGRILARVHPVLSALALGISAILENCFRIGKSLEGSRKFLTDYERNVDSYGNSIPSLAQLSW